MNTTRYRQKLPQMTGEFFLTDAGLETDLIFNQGIDIREFAAHTLLPDTNGRSALADYFRGFLRLANDCNAGMILDSQTWKAHAHWASDLGASHSELKEANHEAIRFIASLREEFKTNSKPIVLNGLIGPRGDAYAPEARVAANEAEEYHSQQVGWLAQTEVDMITGLTFTQSDEAIGLVRASQKAGLPVIISFTVETDGCLPTGQALSDAICHVDDATDNGAGYFMVNCAHPEHFFTRLTDADWSRRIRGFRCNASRLSHAELDECEELGPGDPEELARQYEGLLSAMPWINVFGGCCGTDLRHVSKIAHSLENRFN
ncbi:homocysteine S-methyltransferase family protein [Congregibacter variabilis]|uniref:Homocysteine S-methyltransferase family protein n=1 Tax=Congregibacter variabilis TaxID=3081200 RepID=A0ABZ0I2R6_9GAMM|nr:homocysteine S-methyltransferase family protein [Congregibacter sp. IMCC43200]